jgi:hypothetical protein
MVAIVVEAPLNIYDVAGCISNDGLATPLWPWLVVWRKEKSADIG